MKTPSSQDPSTGPLDNQSVVAAFENNLAIVNVPWNLYITLDCDSRIDLANYSRLGVRGKDVLILPSKTDGHYHVILHVGGTKLFAMQPQERMAYACYAGSDPVREYLSLARYSEGFPFPYKLFMPLPQWRRLKGWQEKRLIGKDTSYTDLNIKRLKKDYYLKHVNDFYEEHRATSF